MNANATSSLRLGVVGLGRHWNRRYRPLLRKRPFGCVVQVVYDATLATARAEADRLGCAVAEGVVELVERPDVDAVLLCDHGWHGLWPLEQARLHGKPVLCVPPLSVEGERGDALLKGLQAEGPVVQFERYVTHGPAPRRLSQLLADERFGRPQIITCDVPASDQEQVLGIVDWVLAIFNLGEPTRTMPESVRSGMDAGGLRTLQLVFAGSRTAQITTYPPGVRSVRFAGRILSTRGRATIRFADQLRWSRGRAAGRVDWRGLHDVERSTLQAFASLLAQPSDWRSQLRWLDECWPVLARVTAAPRI